MSHQVSYPNVAQVAIVDNSKGIEHAERSINNLGKEINVVTRKVKANRKTASGNEELIKEMKKEMTYVKTQVVEFCGYQSSWGKEVTVLANFLKSSLCSGYHNDELPFARSTIKLCSRTSLSPMST